MRRDRGRELISGLVVALATAMLGVLLGFIWYLVAPPLPLKKVQGGLAYTTPDPEQQVAQDGWFAILGLIFGIVVAVAVWVIVRAWRGPMQLVAVTLGALGAGYLAWTIGTQIGTSAYEERLAAAPLDTIVERPPELSATVTRTCLPLSKFCVTTRGGELLVPALGAVVGYSVLAGWSRWPSLRRREEEAEEAAAQAAALEWGQAGPGPFGPFGEGGRGQAGPFGEGEPRPGAPGSSSEPGSVGPFGEGEPRPGAPGSSSEPGSVGPFGEGEPRPGGSSSLSEPGPAAPGSPGPPGSR